MLKRAPIVKDLYALDMQSESDLHFFKERVQFNYNPDNVTRQLILQHMEKQRNTELKKELFALIPVLVCAAILLFCILEGLEALMIPAGFLLALSLIYLMLLTIEMRKNSSLFSLYNMSEIWDEQMLMQGILKTDMEAELASWMELEDYRRACVEVIIHPNSDDYAVKDPKDCLVELRSRDTHKRFPHLHVEGLEYGAENNSLHFYFSGNALAAYIQKEDDKHAEPVPERTPMRPLDYIGTRVG